MIQMLVYHSIINRFEICSKEKIEETLETKGSQDKGILLNLLFCYYNSTILIVSHYLEI